MGILNKIKPTTFLIFGVLLFTFSIVMFFYYLPRPGGESMASFGYLIYSVISLILIIVDRFLVAFMKIKRLSIYEFLFLVAAILGIYIISCTNH
jgi:drug/metabolite transporter (DMT)-like permease